MIFLLSVVLIAAGLWTSVYTHFEGDVIRAEGQSFSGFPNEYVPETMFTASPRALPQIGMTILNVRPQETGRDLSLAGVLVNVLFGGRTSERVLERTLDSSRPLFSDWTFVSVTDFGYAVDYALLNPSERELESQTLSLGTYPPGAEDVFEAVFMGYQFHVSVFPDYVEQDGKPGTRSLELNNPVYRVRIVRNKDIVYEGVMPPGLKLRFDNTVLTFREPSRWVRFRFVRDLGIPVAASGALCLLLGVAFLGLGAVRARAGKP
ncbi:MAG: hypothetical protein GWO24_18800 [Akkermansiaceae bacterium]|nr:hypothetical protein [Akkermansiaceae bacterium]